MKTLEQLMAYEAQAFDGRDLVRLADFLPESAFERLGLTRNSDEPHVPAPLTRDEVLKRLERDVAFAFEKALDKRGISASCMFAVVTMWNWILEEGLENFDDVAGYAQYGLPLFKATALRYGWPNPIGDDRGDEARYASD